jgi:hypothetical protein
MKQSKKTLVLIFLICLAPIVFSYVFFYLYRPSSFTNHGILLNPPVSIKTDLPIFESEPALKGKWLLLTSTDQACESTCEHTLFYINQLKKATGDEQHRVIALGVLPNSEQNKQSNQPRTQLTDLTSIYLSTQQITQFGTFLTRIRPQNINPERFVFKEALLDIWIVDPMGNVIFYYPPGSDPNKLKKDLNKLLKASRIG